jgi:5-(carboxyamino)imidazole ribonucleotide synthase
VRVGIVGGGQLGRMLALAGYPLDIRCTLLDPSADACGGQVAPLLQAAYDDEDGLRRLATASDVVTYEFENVPAGAVEALQSAGAAVHPGPEALATAQDRLAEKTLFRELGIPTAPFAAVDDQASLDAALAEVGAPAILKTRRLGYDGKGQARIDEPREAHAAFEALGAGEVPLLLEGRVPFRRELSVLGVRGRDGELRTYPLVENEHREGILRLSLAPAEGVDQGLQDAADDLARRILERLNYVGVLAVELFEVKGELWANEIAPRVHNSGHWTIEGAETSQFENHLRAVLGLPLGSTAPRGHAAMLNLIGDVPAREGALDVEGAHLHLYGKTGRAGRKVGHVTVVTPDAGATRAAVDRLRDVL